jgi:hypothetical protein
MGAFFGSIALAICAATRVVLQQSDIGAQRRRR